MRIEHWLYTVPLRLRSLFRRSQVDQDLEEELQYHLEKKIEEFMAKGLSPRQARLAALRAMDGLTQRKEECRDMRGIGAIENFLQDVRYGLRVLKKSPGFSAVAVVTLALAIGANAVVFGILNALILRPLNVPRAESLYGIENGRETSMFVSYPDYVDLRDQNRSFDSLAAFIVLEAGLDTGGNPSSSWGNAVSGNYFDAMGIQPHLGRFFHASDEHGSNSVPYVVLGYEYWHNQLAGDRGVVGRIIRVDKHPFTVVGVAPPGFHGALLFGVPDFFVPIVDEELVRGASVVGSDLLNARGNRWVFMTLGHLKAGVTPEQAVADLNSIGAYLDRTYPKDHVQTTFKLARPGLYGNYLGGPARAFLTGLMMLAGLILLAACANLGTLFAARAADRGREVALRLALGSSRSRVLRQLLTEALLISLVGGAVGLWGSVLLLRGMSVWRPLPKMAVSVPVSPDAYVYVLALALALVSALLFGLVPVRQVFRTDPYQIVKAGSKITVGRRVTVRDLLLVTQIAICGVLVTSSLVAVRGLARSLHANFGFEPHNAMLVDTDLNMASYRGDAVPEMQKRMIDGLEKIPGVTSVGLVDFMPLFGGYANVSHVFAGDATDLKPSNAVASAATYRVSPGYFAAAGTVLLAGRAFTWHDDKNAPHVAVINQECARRIAGSVAGALGRSYKMQDGTFIQVAGVVEDGKYANLTEDPRAAMFLPIVQWPSTGTNLVVRSNRDSQHLAAALRSTVRKLDAGLPCGVQTWNEELDLALFPSRAATVSLGVLGAMGAMLAVTGIFGMAAYSVSRRLRELGIRMALGAQRKEVLHAALGRALKLLALGSAAGVFLGILASRVLAYIVYHATPRDPLVLAGVVAVMLLLGLLATWIPAQRALSLDPVALLREE